MKRLASVECVRSYASSARKFRQPSGNNQYPPRCQFWLACARAEQEPIHRLGNGISDICLRIFEHLSPTEGLSRRQVISLEESQISGEKRRRCPQDKYPINMPGMQAKLHVFCLERKGYGICAFVRGLSREYPLDPPGPPADPPEPLQFLEPSFRIFK